jgi:YVTN family beta-propeller protein
MKRIIFLSACIIGIALLFSSCQKDDSMDNTDNTPVSYDAAYVVNGESNSISVIDLSSNQVKKTIDLAQLSSGTMGGINMDNMWPHHIYLSPDKSKLAIAAPGMDFSGGHNSMMMQTITETGTSTDSHSQHHGGSSSTTSVSSASAMEGKILILDAVTGALLKELTLEGMTHNAVFSPDSKEIWTALMMTGGKVKVFDANTYNLISTIPVGDMPAEVTFSSDGSKAFVANGMSNTVTVIDATSKQILDTIQVGDDPVGAWPGMDGMMYVDNEEGESIYVINSMNMMVMDTVHLGFMPGMAAHNNMKNEMWVSDPDNGKMHYWMKQDTGYVHGGAFNVGSGAHAIVFTSDGSTCYVTNQNEGTVSVIDVTNHKEVMKISVGNKPNGLVIRKM